jgi:hypothetical protein
MSCPRCMECSGLCRDCEEYLYGEERHNTMTEIQLSRNELKTLFYVGRNLELIACYIPMAAPQARTVAAHKSYSFEMRKADGKLSRMDFEKGMRIIGISPAGNGFTEVKIVDASGQTAAHYRLL